MPFAMISSRGYFCVMEQYVEQPERLLCVEMCAKWYGLILIEGENVTEIPFPMNVKGRERDTPFRDHVPNPKVVRQYAENEGIYLDELSYEMILGRWISETTELENLL